MSPKPIPVIDIEPLVGKGGCGLEIIAQIREACREWGEFRWKRQQGDYDDYGQENQIADYQIPEVAGLKNNVV